MKSFIKYIILVLVSFQCSKNKVVGGQANEQVSNNKEIEISQEFIIKGISEDEKPLQYINLTNDSYFFGENHKDLKKEFYGDSLRLVLKVIKTPQFIEFWVGGDTLYHANLFVIPGDSISFEIKNKKLRFKGENAALHNFYSELENSTLNYQFNPYKGNLNKYKQQIKFIYEEKLEFFNQYIKENKIVLNTFNDAVYGELRQEYLNNLISPRNKQANGDNTLFFNEYDGLIPIIEKEFGDNEQLFDAAEYFDNVSIEDFKNPQFLNDHFFKNNLNLFIRYYFENSNHVPYSKEKLLSEKRFIQNNFDEELELYAIGRMISDYSKKGFGYSINNIEFMRSLIDEYEDKFIKPSYKKRMDEIKDDLIAFNFKISESALETKLLSPIGDTLTLKEIFGRSTKRIRVINFWASWCPPCIDEIKKGKTFKDKLSIEDNVEWIYLSIDKDKDRWLSKSEELKHFLNVRNQYLVLRGEYSSLGKSLKVKGVPRYVILNKQNQIVLSNAPKPSNKIVFKKIIDNIN